jgi:hypothetical protein
MVTDGSPFRAANDPNVLYGKYREEQILIGTVIPVFIHLDRASQPGQGI